MRSATMLAVAVALVAVGAALAIVVTWRFDLVTEPDAPIYVEVIQPTATPAPPTPVPTRTPKPPALPPDTPARRMAFVPDDWDPGTAGVCAQPSIAPAGADWWANLPTPSPGGCAPASSYFDQGETAALGTGTLHLPRCAANRQHRGRFVLASPASDYPDPTQLLIDGVDQIGAFVRQSSDYAYPAGGPAYHLWVSAYEQRCEVWDGDAVSVRPAPLPTPTPPP